MDNKFLEELLKHVSVDDVERLVVGVLCIYSGPWQAEDGIVNFDLLARRIGFLTATSARDKYFQSKDRVQIAYDKIFGTEPPPTEESGLAGWESTTDSGYQDDQVGGAFGLDGAISERDDHPANCDDDDDLYTASPPRPKVPAVSRAPETAVSLPIRKSRSRLAKGRRKPLAVEAGSSSEDSSDNFEVPAGGGESEAESDDNIGDTSDDEEMSENEPLPTSPPKTAARTSRSKASASGSAKPKVPPRKRAAAKPRASSKAKSDEDGNPLPSKSRALPKKSVDKNEEPAPTKPRARKGRQRNADLMAKDKPKPKTKGELILEAIESDPDEFLDPKLPELRRLMAGSFDTMKRLGGMKKKPKSRTPSPEWDPLEFGDPIGKRREAMEKKYKAADEKVEARAKRAMTALENKLKKGLVTDEEYAETAQEIQTQAEEEKARARAGEGEEAYEEEVEVADDDKMDEGDD